MNNQNKLPELSEYIEDPSDKWILLASCIVCDGRLTVGERKAFGMCIECYDKLREETLESQTGMTQDERDHLG